MNPGALIIVSAPSGAGKTTLVNAAITELSSDIQIKRVITYTSRTMRQGEIPGVDYHFVSHEDFEQAIEKGFFIEWSSVYGAYYGTPCSIIEDLACGINLMLIPDRNGAFKIIEHFNAYIYKVITIWVETPSLEILETRLRLRGQNSQEQIAARLKLAVHEIEQEKINPLYNHKIINDNLQKTIENLKNVIKKSINFEEKKQNKSGLEYGEKAV